MIADLCETELNRPRGTEPLKGIIDKLNKEEKVPHNIIVSMLNLNSLSAFGAHPKDFDLRQVKPVISDLTTIIDWYLKHTGTETKAAQVSAKATTTVKGQEHPARGKSRKKPILIGSILVVCAAIVVVLLVFDIIGQRATAGSIQSIAVLPFDNFTGDDELEYFVSGMHSSMITDIGQVSSLRVISKTSSRAYKNIDMSVSQIAAELEVDAIVEASVMCLGDSICVEFKLVNASDEEELLWTGEYKAEKSQILNLYSQVTKEISEEIKVELSPEEQARIAESKTINPEAYDAFLKARYYWDQLTPEALQKSLEYYTIATQIEPEWAEPYAGITEFWGGMRQFGFAPSSITVPNIYSNLNKALALDPNSPRVRFVNAMIAVWTGFDWELGEEEALKVLAGNPSDAYCRAYYSHLLMFLKRQDDALLQARQALDLDPLNPLIQGLSGVVYWHAGDMEKAHELAEKIVAVVPNHPLGQVLSWSSHHGSGNHEEAIAVAGMIFRMEQDVIQNLQQTSREKGYQAALDEMIGVVTEMTKSIYITRSRIVYLCILAQQYDLALDWVERGWESRDPDIPYVFTGSEMYNSINEHPRFIKVEQDMGLPSV